jgi:hypothetical protein
MTITKLIQHICEYRLLIGFMGEKHQSAWWDCAFMSASSRAFLAPVYPNSVPLAQYSGVCRAAAIVHDEHIGIGRHFHLFRLPDAIEQTSTKCMQEGTFARAVNQFTTDKDSAMNRLKEIGSDAVDSGEGPVVVGDFSDTRLNVLLKKSVSHYLDAFEHGYRTFPYMRCV